jgi:hypothetical protein
VAHEYTCLAAVSHRTPVPDTESSVVGTGVKDMWGGGIAEADSIYIILVILQPHNGFACFDVVDDDTMVRCSRNNLSAIPREAE